MCSITLLGVVSVLATSLASAGNSTVDSDACGLVPGLEPGPWAAALEQWATTDHGEHTRQGRIMALPPTQGYYVTDRMDLMPPPPPPPQHHHPMHLPPHYTQSGPPYPNSAPPHHNSGPPTKSAPLHHNSGPPHHNSGSPHHNSGPPHHTQPGTPQHPPGRPYEEWQVTQPPPPSTSKIVNRPPNPYNDKFRPSYPDAANAVDRVDEPPPSPSPNKQVSETDLVLLGAIEKLVFRVDIMEKRLRKMEEAVHFLVAGTHTKPEPCASEFTRVGASCYHFSSDPLNWKGASIACRKRAATLLELDAPHEKRTFQSALLADKRLKGVDWWTGGLNPGLLWIWSHSARPVSGNDTSSSASTLSASTSSDTSTIVGAGRCLALVHEPALNAYVYRGQDCGLKHRYVCETLQDTTKLSNEVERVARLLKDRFTTTESN